MNKKVLMYIIIAWAVLATVLACVFGAMLIHSENPNVDKDKAQLVDFNNLEFEMSVDGTSYTVKGTSSKINFLTKIDEIIIPSEYDGLPVTGIGNSAFICLEVKKVKIPDSVTSIGAYAFRMCRSLTTLEIPDSVTSIGDYAFSDCTSLTSITIPDSVTSIGNCAFQDCTSLTNIEIPNSITSIGSRAFSKCSSLTKIVIPNSVKNIGSWAFAYCFNLTINCEAKSQPSDWNNDWNPSNCPVVWDYKSE